MAKIPTVKIKDPNLEGSFIVINESDFNAAVHERFEEPAAPDEPKGGPPKPEDKGGEDQFPEGYRYEKASGGYGYLYFGDVLIEGPSNGKWQGRDGALMAAKHHAESHAGE